MAKKNTYQLKGSHRENGKVYLRGDSIELTEEEAQAPVFTNRLILIENKKTTSKKAKKAKEVESEETED